MNIEELFTLSGTGVSVPSLPAGGKTKGGFHKTAPMSF